MPNKGRTMSVTVLQMIAETFNLLCFRQMFADCQNTLFYNLRPCWAGKTEESPGVYSFRVCTPRRQVVTCSFWPLARSARGPQGAGPFGPPLSCGIEAKVPRSKEERPKAQGPKARKPRYRRPRYYKRRLSRPRVPRHQGQGTEVPGATEI